MGTKRGSWLVISLMQGSTGRVFILLTLLVSSLAPIATQGALAAPQTNVSSECQGACSSPATAQSPTISVSPPSGPPGTHVTIRGSGYQPHLHLYVNWTSDASGSVVIGDVTTDDAGAFTWSGALPLDQSPGDHTITVSDTADTTYDPTSSCPITVAISCGGASQPPTQPVSSSSMCQSYCPVTPRPNNFVCVGGIPGLCNLTPPSPHHYIIFVDGINSHADSSGDYAYLDHDFGDIKNTLRQVGFHDSQFVYFSYASAHVRQQGFKDCAGYSGGCVGSNRRGNDDGEIANINDTPVYSVDDTKLDLTAQADALHWLIFETVLKDRNQGTQIDIVGYSLGGVITSYWAATHPRDSDPIDGPAIHSLILLDSPVGGIAPATSVLDGTLAQPLANDFIRDKFGTTVLTQLQMMGPTYPPPSCPGRGDTANSIIACLPQAALNYPLTSIESNKDYFVDGQPLPFFGDQQALSIGSGARGWLANTYQPHLSDSLGGSDPPTPFVSDYPGWVAAGLWALNNHGTPLHSQTAAVWIAQAVTAP
jgi:pimeloyl-ACP methyl ester carboxylesterase